MPNIDIYGRIVYEDELYHHGISGMKWGKRNGPPYPLTASAHSSAEKKAGWRSSLSSAKDASKKVYSKVKNAVEAKHEKQRQKRLDDMKKKPKSVNKKQMGNLIKSMSDTELNERIERLKKEDEYKRLLGKKTFSEAKQENHQAAKQFVNEALKVVGQQVIIPAVTGNKSKNKNSNNSNRNDKSYGSSNTSSIDSSKNKKKKAIKTAAAVAGTALAAYGGYKLYQSGALDKAGSAIKSASEASKQHRAESKTSFIKQLSDKDLNDRITRMKNENTYAELMGRKYVNGYKGSKKLFNDTMNAIGSRVIVPIGVGTAAYVVESQVRSKYGDEVSRKVFKTVNEKKK